MKDIEKIDTSTLDGKLRILEILLEGDRVPYPYRIKKSAKEAYLKAIQCFMEYAEQGMCDMHFDDIDDPLELHSIHITWLSYGDMGISLEPKLLEVLAGMSEGMTIDEMDGQCTWGIWTRIYFGEGNEASGCEM